MRPQKNWILDKPLDYIPMPRRKRKSALERIFAQRNKEFRKATPEHEHNYVGRMFIGSTNNQLPDEWTYCKVQFEKCNLILEMTLNQTTVVVRMLSQEEFDFIWDMTCMTFISMKIILLDGNIFFDLYFCDFPIKRFTKSIGNFIKKVLCTIHNIPISDNDNRNLFTENDITQLYKDIRCEREKDLNLSTENVQDVRLNANLRPYQSDAVRWMLLREKKSTELEDDLHPLYAEITLPSGTKWYMNKSTGHIELTKPLAAMTSKGGILADEMGLGKTIEVLTLILNHPKTETDFDLTKSPTLNQAQRKRVREEVKTETPPIQSKKLKVPENWVKGKSKKSENYIALSTWYESVLTSANKSKEVKNESRVQCICGGSNETDLVTCCDCEKVQHGGCVGYKAKFGPYRCPQCWILQPLIDVKATLIVVPISLRTQWCKEVVKHVKGDFKVLQYAGTSLTPVYPTDLEEYDIVITTYNVLQSELRLVEGESRTTFRHQKKYSVPGSPLTRVKWWRLCLDEAQTVESPSTMITAMCNKLDAYFRWAVTGTPISKHISDLYGLINYLEMEPYNDKSTWDEALFNPYIDGRKEPMLKFLSQVLWRSCKNDVIDQINIPKQTIQEYSLTFSATEQYFYKCEHGLNATEFIKKCKQLLTFGKNPSLQSLDKKALKSLLVPLISLRQVCTYPNSTKIRYLETKKPVKTIEDLLKALISKNTNENEEFLRVVLSSLNGLGGVHLLLQSPENAVEEYRKVLEIYTRFIEEEKLAKLSVDVLQVIHAMHNLAETLEFYIFEEKNVKDATLRQDCTDLEQKYIGKFINQSMSALHSTLLISANVKKIQNDFVLDPGEWYSELLDWIYIHDYNKELYTKIENLHSAANVKTTLRSHAPRSLIYDLEKWDTLISKVREDTFNIINDLYTHCPKDEFKIIIDKKLVYSVTNCHLRPIKKNKTSKKCAMCLANEGLKNYEMTLFSMSERVGTEEMSLQGSWKASSEELIFRSILAVGKARNCKSDLVKDGEAHMNILDNFKKEFKELRKFWTHLDKQICALDELDMCKTRLQLKRKDDEEQKGKNPIAPILKNLSYKLQNKTETIHLLNEYELEHQKLILMNEEKANMKMLEKNLGVRNYLETLYKQQFEKQSPNPCPICMNDLQKDWSIVPCGHCYCTICMQRLIKQTTGRYVQCCICRVNHKVSDISIIKLQDDSTPTNELTKMENVKIYGNYSTKVEGIVKLVLGLKKKEPNVKILLFSSWSPVLIYIGEAFTVNNIKYAIGASGSLEKQVERFKDANEHVSVLMLPISLGGKGLNLVEATHVILTEPLLNSGDELQAISRVHRIGQTRPTVVHKFIVQNTIEESIQKAVSSDSKHWEMNTITIQQIMDLFQTDEIEDTDTAT